jgi:MbtH protein
MSDDDGRRYQVVINSEEQYSIWPAESPRPAGWRPAGPAGDRQACLDYIAAAWSDLRPLSLRREME